MSGFFRIVSGVCVLLLVVTMVVAGSPPDTVNPEASQNKPKHWIDWKNLTNPVLEYPNWSIKDFAAEYHDGVFYLFFSAFQEDRGQTRSHVVLVTTTDWKTFSSPIFDISGEDQGWTGMCSPNLTKASGTYYCTFNSWGKKHPNGGTNDLFFISSDDLRNWSPYQQIAPELSRDKTCIDVCVLHENNRFYLYFKDDYLDGERLRFKRVRLAVSDEMDGDYRWVGSGYVNFLVDDRFESGQNHENYCVFKDPQDTWRMLTTDYGMEQHAPWLYTLLGDIKSDYHFLTWGKGHRLEVKREEWNPHHRYNAAALYDWRTHDGYYYLLYAGSKKTDDSGYKYAGRGWNRLGLARSKDLVNWELPGKGK